MTFTVCFTVPGEPIGKGRPRLSTRGGFARAYTPAKTRAYESRIADAARQAMAGRAPLDGPLVMHVVAEFAPPASMSKRKRAAVLAAETYHAIRTDIDNAAKAVLDACNGVLFADDKQVVWLQAHKRWAEAAKLWVMVRPYGVTV